MHRLLAIAFIPNPNNLPQINHKDENPSNNDLSNLEWCSPQYNLLYGTRGIRAAKTRGKKCRQLDLDGKLINTFYSISEAARSLNLSNSSISACCLKKPKHKTCGGYK